MRVFQRYLLDTKQLRGGYWEGITKAERGKKCKLPSFVKILLWSSEPMGIFGLFFLWVFFLRLTLENMSVLPTNATVFYVIFIDKRVDKF